MERARQAAQLQEETAEKERQKQHWDAAELFAKQKEDANRKLAAMAAEAERKRQEVQRQLMHAQQETKHIWLKPKRRLIDMGFLRKLFTQSLVGSKAFTRLPCFRLILGLRSNPMVKT